jgi:hypothetical protein
VKVLFHDAVGDALPALAAIARPPQQRGGGRDRANSPAMLVIAKTQRTDGLREYGDLLPALISIAGRVHDGCVRVRCLSSPGVLRIHHVDILAVDAAKLGCCPALATVIRHIEVNATVSGEQQGRHDTGRAEEDQRGGDPFTYVGKATG